MAQVLAKNDPQAEITVCLMAAAVFCDKAGQKTPEGYYNLERLIRRARRPDAQPLQEPALHPVAVVEDAIRRESGLGHLADCGW
ncbi:hypothetical protein [Hoeflea alexandrii]|uniref:hypothetical protein n=1 Tax=Hoeflea alexandrii TaxID=288436 RepID=UPI0036237346